MAEIRKSKVNKMLTLSTRHICSVTPITSTHVLSHPCFRSNNCKCGYLLCCVAARVLHFSAFISLVLFQFGCYNFSVEVFTKRMYSGPNNILCESCGTLRYYLSQTCIHAMLDNSLICSEGSALQRVFIIYIYLILFACDFHVMWHVS